MPVGTFNVDSNGQPLSAVTSQIAGEFVPADHGLTAWSYDPALAANSSIMPTAGLVQTVRIKLNAATTITNLYLFCTTAGVTLTAGQCLAGIYQNGTLLGTTVDQSTAWTTAGVKTMALTTPVVVSGTDLIIGFFYNGVTAPTFSRSAGTTALINANIAATASRFATADAARTTSLATTLATLAGTSLSYWAAIS